MSFFKWLYPGMHVKRWLVLLTIGIVLIGLGIAYVLTHFYRETPFPESFYWITLQFVPRLWRAAIAAIVGLGAIAYAVWQLNRSLLSAVSNGSSDSLVDIIYQHRHLKRGPKVVAIGGGTGLSTLLRGLKEYTSNLTAIVTVADDGGSSGRLRRELGILPPGDFRNCIVALADAEPLMGQLFQYRFGEGTGLEGHPFGNLFIVAMTGVTGNFENAIRESSRVLAVRGQILPSTLENLTLCAELEDEVLAGESNISKTRKPIRRVFLQPNHPAGYPDALSAIRDADYVILGPGSLYTSVIPNLLVEDVARAVRASKAVKVYVCNVATQPGETDGFKVDDHVNALLKHAGNDVVNFVLANSNLDYVVKIKPEWHVDPVSVNGNLVSQGGPKLVKADVVNPENPLRHEPRKLAQALMRLYYDGASEKVESNPVATQIAGL
jgi:uncharacterized cofD-like protein